MLRYRDSCEFLTTTLFGLPSWKLKQDIAKFKEKSALAKTEGNRMIDDLLAEARSGMMTTEETPEFQNWWQRKWLVCREWMFCRRVLEFLFRR